MCRTGANVAQSPGARYQLARLFAGAPLASFAGMEASSMTNYENGFRFATVYGRTHGLRALLSLVRRDATKVCHTVARSYLAGELDAALLAVTAQS